MPPFIEFSPLPLPSLLRAVHLGPSGGEILKPLLQPYPHPPSHALSPFRAVHLGPSGAPIIHNSFYLLPQPHRSPGRPFRAVYVGEKGKKNHAPHPPCPLLRPRLLFFVFVCLVVCSFLVVSLSFLCRRTGPPMLRFPWLAQRSQPWLSSRPSLTAQYEGEALCLLTWNFTTSMSSTSQQPLNHGDSNLWAFSRAPLAVAARERLKLGGLAIPTYDLSAVPSLQMADGSEVTFSALHLSLFLSSSTSETDGQFSYPQHVPSLRAPLLVRLLLVLLSQYLPLPCHRYDTRWSVLWRATVLQGSCQ